MTRICLPVPSSASTATSCDHLAGLGTQDQGRKTKIEKVGRLHSLKLRANAHENISHPERKLMVFQHLQVLSM